MDAWGRRRGSRLALFLILALPVAIAGCGSDGDGAGEGDPSAAQPAAGDASSRDAADAAGGSDAGAGSGDERQIRDLFDRMSTAIAARDAKAACPLMAKSAQRTFKMLADPGPKTCERGFAAAFAEGIGEAADPELVRVEIQGPRAIVYARTAASGKPEQAPFVREGEQWKVESWLTD